MKFIYTFKVQNNYKMKSFLNKRLFFAGILNLIFGTIITSAHWENGYILIRLGILMLTTYIILRSKSAPLFEDQHNFKRNSVGFWLFATLIIAGFTIILFNSMQYPQAGTILVVAGILGELWMVMREYGLVRKV